MEEKKCVACGEALQTAENGLTMCEHCELPHVCNPFLLKPCATFYHWAGSGPRTSVA